MEKPTLVILAAGMGSRYGGLKQIDPVDDKGNKIIDFSIYDAVRAGFGKVVFIIKREHEQDFRECIGNAVSKHIPGADEGSGRISDSGRPRKALGNRTCNPVLQGRSE